MAEIGNPKKSVRLGDVLKAGHKFGLQDSGAQKLFREWIREAQSQVEMKTVARIKLEITCAEMYMELDLMEEAAECFRDALTQALQEGVREVVLDLERALETLDTPSVSRYTL